MRTIILPVLLAGLMCAAGRLPAGAAPAADDLILQCHCLGMNQLPAGAAKLKQIWSLPASADLRKQLAEQLARLPFLALSNSLAKGTPDQAALFRPLFDDLLPAESFLEWRGPAGPAGEFVFAIRLSDDRARLWGTNLRQALTAWKLGAFAAAKPDAAQNWVFKKKDGGALAFTRAGQWVVLGLGAEPLKLHAAVVQRIGASGRPVAAASAGWLEADANLARLKSWLPLLAPYQNLPVVHVNVSEHADHLRTTMALQFPAPHGWKSEPWMLPTSVIRDPVISFTVAQGIAPLLKAWPFFQRLGLEPQPNQVTFWAQAQFPFLTHLAMPVASAGPQIARLSPLLPSLVLSNSPHPLPGNIGWNTNFQAIVWSGLPMAMPQITAIKDRKGEYLFGSLFPRFPSTNTPPPDLFKQVEGRANLAYYDWEITEARLKQWRALYQLLDIITGHTFVKTNAPSQVWLLAAAPLLGDNTATEMTVTSPTEMKLVRSSLCGFTSFELVSLMRWLDSPEFPRFSVTGQNKPARPARLPAPAGSPKGH